MIAFADIPFSGEWTRVPQGWRRSRRRGVCYWVTAVAANEPIGTPSNPFVGLQFIRLDGSSHMIASRRVDPSVDVLVTHYSLAEIEWPEPAEFPL